MRTLPFVTLATLVLAASAAHAQGSDAHAGMHMDHMDMHHASGPLSAVTRKQLDSVATATLPLGAPGAASAAGFHPVFGWIPTMGVHWVDRLRMSKGVETERDNPSNLMFSKIAGKDSLVGAAYAYFTGIGDSTPPKLFDGAPAWHEHPDLAPPGQRLVMLHVWFVPSPDGPFAGTNPNLPFWAVGLDAPDSLRIQRDPAFSLRVRKAALALAEVADTTSIFPNLERRPDVAPSLAAHRDSIRALIPQFRAARGPANFEKWNRVAQRAAAQWDAIYDTYLSSARTAAGRERMENYVAMLLGQHHE